MVVFYHHRCILAGLYLLRVKDRNALSRQFISEVHGLDGGWHDDYDPKARVFVGERRNPRKPLVLLSINMKVQNQVDGFMSLANHRETKLGPYRMFSSMTVWSKGGGRDRT